MQSFPNPGLGLHTQCGRCCAGIWIGNERGEDSRGEESGWNETWR